MKFDEFPTIKALNKINKIVQTSPSWTYWQEGAILGVVYSTPIKIFWWNDKQPYKEVGRRMFVREDALAWISQHFDEQTIRFEMRLINDAGTTYLRWGENMVQVLRTLRDINSWSRGYDCELVSRSVSHLFRSMQEELLINGYGV